MEIERSRPSWNVRNPISLRQTLMLVCLVATLSYFAPRLEGALMLNPQTVWPLWPGFAILMPVLWLVPRRLWLILIPVAFASFALYDLQVGVPLRSIAWFIPADTFQVLIAALSLNYFCDGLPQLNNVDVLAKYLSFVVILAPFTAAFISAPGIRGSYWSGWRISFFSDVLAYLTLTPAILSWVSDGRAWLQKESGNHLEAAAAISVLTVISYINFTAPVGSTSPAWLYSLVPALLWLTLRFGSLGTSSAVIIVAFLAIWGAVHGRGPFIEKGPAHNVLSLQLFLICTAIPFMVLAAVAEERKSAEEALHERQKELLEAQRVSRVGSWQWNPKTDEVVWSTELCRIAGRDPNLPPPTFQQQTRLYTADSWGRLKLAIDEALKTGAPYTLDLEIVWPDGSTRWITDRGEVLRDGAGRITRLSGTAQDITERKHAEDELRASEEKFRSVFRDAGVGMVIVSAEGRFLAANETFCECLGYTEEELLEKTVESITRPEDWPSFSQKFRKALEQGIGFQRVEKHCLHKSGRIVTTECSASLIRGSSGDARYFVGEVLDITQRKLAEEALSGVSGRLIEAHEEERRWIARELHDDFNQRVAMLAIILEMVKRGLPTAEGAARRGIEEASQQVTQLGSDIQALSHRLHSSRLDYLGLVAAAAGFCQEFSNRQDVKIDFHSENIPQALPKEVSLCLFRVLQEALQNSLKHSGERRFEVSLKCAMSEIELTVHDSGVGFDPEKIIGGHGLGLTSMKERLKLVDGLLSIESKPQEGTTIHAQVPLALKVKSAAV